MPELMPGLENEKKSRGTLKVIGRFLLLMGKGLYKFLVDTKLLLPLVIIVALFIAASVYSICNLPFFNNISESHPLYYYAEVICPEPVTPTPTTSPTVSPTPTITPEPTVDPKKEWALVITGYNEDECLKAKDYASRLQTMGYPVVVIHDIGADEKTNWHVMLFGLTENQAEAMKNEFSISYTLKPIDVAYYKNCRISSSACVEHIECE